MMNWIGTLRERWNVHQFERHLPAYLNGAVSGRRQRWIAQQLVQSEACRSELEAYRRMEKLVRSVPARHPNAVSGHEVALQIRERVASEGGVARDDAGETDPGFLSMVAYGAVVAFVGMMVGGATLYGVSQLLPHAPAVRDSVADTERSSVALEGAPESGSR